MQRGKLPSYSFLILIVLSAAILTSHWMEWPIGRWKLLSAIGRVHPIVVHVPIVLIPLTLIWDWITARRKNQFLSRIFSQLLNGSLWFTLVAWLVGHALAHAESYEGQTISWHARSASAVLILLLWTRYYRKAYQVRHKYRLRTLYKTLLTSAVLVVLFTGHLGGSITHGSRYLTEPWTTLWQQPSSKEGPQSSNQLRLYDHMVKPILIGKCVECHNATKTKGGLDMTTLAGLLSPAKSGKVPILPGSLEQSEIWQRINLPVDSDEFMPPDGHTPLSEIEVQVIREWVKRSDPRDTLGSLQDHLKTHLGWDQWIDQAFRNAQTGQARIRARRILQPKMARLSLDLGLDIQMNTANDSAFYQVQMKFPPKFVDDQTLKGLMSVRNAIQEISLTGSNVTDEGLYYLGQMPYLRVIDLSKTCVTGEGFKYLSNLSELQQMNVSHTRVDNPRALELTKHPTLRQLKLFNALVDQNVVEAVNNSQFKLEMSLTE